MRNVARSSLFIVFILSLVSCMSEKKLAKVCSEKFPIRDSLIVKERLIIDTINIKGDTVIAECPPLVVRDTTTGKIIKVPVYKKVACPDKQFIYKTVIKDSLIYRENTAKVSSQNTIIQKQENTISKLRFYQKWFWILVICIPAYFVLRFYLRKALNYL
jgi:hypothetical protein